mmetsp:Transcript_9069/g.28875  ORF Transcript_9069/g.28875 Transcript_9069/m.28875 type:complete len:201 (-) Transcript_9069:2043-2645(-)
MLALQQLLQGRLPLVVAEAGPAGLRLRLFPSVLEVHLHGPLPGIALEGEALATGHGHAGLLGRVQGHRRLGDVLAGNEMSLALGEAALKEPNVPQELVLLVGQHHAGAGDSVGFENVQVLVVFLAPVGWAWHRLEPRERVAQHLPQRAVLVVLVRVREQPTQDFHAHEARAPHEAVEAAGVAVRASQLRQGVLHVDLVPR